MKWTIPGYFCHADTFLVVSHLHMLPEKPETGIVYAKCLAFKMLFIHFKYKLRNCWAEAHTHLGQGPNPCENFWWPISSFHCPITKMLGKSSCSCIKNSFYCLIPGILVLPSVDTSLRRIFLLQNTPQFLNTTNITAVSSVSSFTVTHAFNDFCDVFSQPLAGL